MNLKDARKVTEAFDAADWADAEALSRLKYLQETLLELRETAHSDGRHVVAYIIDMAYLHCSDELRELKNGRSPPSPSSSG